MGTLRSSRPRFYLREREKEKERDRHREQALRTGAEFIICICLCSSINETSRINDVCVCARGRLSRPRLSLFPSLALARARDLSHALSFVLSLSSHHFTPSTPSSFSPVCMSVKRRDAAVYCSRLRTEVTCEMTASVTFSRASACRSSTFCVRVVCAYACV
jgi:hypothetical protein